MLQDSEGKAPSSLHEKWLHGRGIKKFDLEEDENTNEINDQTA